MPLAAFAGQDGLVQKTPNFTATVTGFQTSLGAHGVHFATVTVHFANTTDKPLILGSDKKKTSMTDDQGNRYGLAWMRGIGSINGSDVDTSFVLPAKGSGDALFELSWGAPNPNVIFGVSFDLSLTARELTVLPSHQVEMGTERLVEFTGLKTGLVPQETTVDAGAFKAEIAHSKFSFASLHGVLTGEFTVRFTNTTDKPIILAYAYRSSYGVDDQGNRFGVASSDRSTSGIGVSASGNADPQFVLAPGESREAHFAVARNKEKEIAGTEMSYYVAIEQLEVLPSNQIRVVRQYSLAFPHIKAS